MNNSMDANIKEIKLKNRKMEKQIKHINFISYLLSILFILTVEMRVINVFDYIESDSHFFSIVAICVILSGVASLFIYSLILAPHIKKIRDKILKNNYKILRLREHDIDRLEMKRLSNSAKFHSIEKQSAHLHN